MIWDVNFLKEEDEEEGAVWIAKFFYYSAKNFYFFSNCSPLSFTYDLTKVIILIILIKFSAEMMMKFNYKVESSF